jgi:hypothetical protein
MRRRLLALVAALGLAVDARSVGHALLLVGGSVMRPPLLFIKLIPIPRPDERTSPI